MRRSVLLCCAAMASAALSGQALTEFPGGPQRQPTTLIAAPQSPMPATVVVAIAVDRGGKVVSATVDRERTTTKDPDLLKNAVERARGVRFNANADAPERQSGCVNFAKGLAFTRLDEDEPVAQQEITEALLSSEATESDDVPGPPMDPDLNGSDPNAVFAFAQEMPQFPGGQEAMMEYLQKQTQYPAAMREANIQGKVFVGFVVEKDGRLTHVEVKRGVPGGKQLDDEAVRVMKTMPNWLPGKQGGTPVRVWMILPVQFKL